jgi:serine/threonine-protein kinase RsbW
MNVMDIDMLTQFKKTIPSNLEAIDLCCSEAEHYLRCEGLSAHVFPIMLMLREGLTNAVLHGNREDPRKSVSVLVKAGKKWITIHVRDQGPGFDWQKREQHRALDDDTSGRGMEIYHLYANRVHFNQTGNGLSLWRSRKEG